MERVLVVDDEPEITKALRRLLKTTYEVETATSPEEALAKLATFQPDVVISDFRMPGMTGAELLAEVKRRLPLTLRLILSGFADLDSVLDSVNQGEVCRFLNKPWDSDELLALLARLLNDRRVLTQLYQPFHQAIGLVSEAHQRESGLRVETRVIGPFDAEQAAALLRKIVGALGDGELSLVGGLLERHAGRISFIAEVGGEQRLTLEVPLHPKDLHAAEG